MKIKTKDDIQIEITLGQQFTTPEQCDLIGKTFSDGRITGVVKEVYMKHDKNWMASVWLSFGQNRIRLTEAFQACRWCHSPMEWYEFMVYSLCGEPPVKEEVYQCQCCYRPGERAESNVKVDMSEIPF
jgi:hypothetical protein